MTFPSDDSKSLINYEKLSREVICISPEHGTTIMLTRETKPLCPICNTLMVNFVKSALTGEIITTPREK